ncbi:MAG: aminoacyl-tRNA hydrolase [Bacteroidia bacterium]|nr:aminoacyl-tRNA hydrolase [Bacteroidia bacterium]
MNIFLTKSLDFYKWFKFITSRSSGPGGQNVNKVNSRVELRININECDLFSDVEKEIIYKKLENKINKEFELVIVRQTERSQLKNKEKAIEAFYKIIETALKKEKVRKKSKPSKAVIQKRLEEKKKLSEKKNNRRKV